MTSRSPAHRARNDLYARCGKRVLDLCVASIALLVLSPLMLLIALLIKLQDRGPVLFRQERVGRGGRTFFLTKFRSMVPGAETQGAGILVERNDPRVTRVGRILRKLSLDELTQLFDVLRGSMSLVGPRPGLPYQAEQYSEEQRLRLAVRPGITGWAQIKGRKAIAWPERIRLDLEYIDRMGLWLDIAIILRTFPAMLSGSNQLAKEDYWKRRRREIDEARGKPAGTEKP